ncbi:hypothetical protein QRQ56_34710 [Bradyrhizobium sp. U531]|uniref:hypothetical protein n=1 Tax=Bradyrhizobium sp. U531 TaxID=3053458 RepID=UPI003F41E7EE
MTATSTDRKLIGFVDSEIKSYGLSVLVTVHLTKERMEKVAGMVIVCPAVGELPGAGADYVAHDLRPEHLSAIRPKLKQIVGNVLARAEQLQQRSFPVGLFVVVSLGRVKGKQPTECVASKSGLRHHHFLVIIEFLMRGSLKLPFRKSQQKVRLLRSGKETAKLTNSSGHHAKKAKPSNVAFVIARLRSFIPHAASHSHIADVRDPSADRVLGIAQTRLS